MPRLYIISGCNGSGKTTASYSMLPEIFQCSQFVNSDEFAKGLSPFNPERASVGASRYMLLKIRYLFSKKEDFCIETTLATRSLLKMIQTAKQQGYVVTLLYFWLNSPELAIKRVHARVMAGGHNIEENTIRRRYYMGVYYLFRDFMPVCDKWMLADNSKTPFTMIAESERGKTVIYDQAKYARIQKMNEDYSRTKEHEKQQ